jgi:hypothetical protein
LWLPQKFADLPPGLEPSHSEAIINKDDPNQQAARQAAQSALPVADDSDDRNWRTRAPLPPAADGAAPPERELIRGPPAANGAPERPSPSGPRPTNPQQVKHCSAVTHDRKRFVRMTATYWVQTTTSGTAMQGCCYISIIAETAPCRMGRPAALRPGTIRHHSCSRRLTWGRRRGCQAPHPQQATQRWGNICTGFMQQQQPCKLTDIVELPASI